MSTVVKYVIDLNNYFDTLLYIHYVENNSTNSSMPLTGPQHHTAIDQINLHQADTYNFETNKICTN